MAMDRSAALVLTSTMPIKHFIRSPASKSRAKSNPGSFASPPPFLTCPLRLISCHGNNLDTTQPETYCNSGLILFLDFLIQDFSPHGRPYTNCVQHCEAHPNQAVA